MRSGEPSSRSPLRVYAPGFGRFRRLLSRSLKAFPGHLPPRLFLPEHQPECLEAPPHRPLAVAEVLERREQQEPPQIPEPVIPLKADLLEHHGPERQQHPVAPRHEHEEQREVGVHGAEQQPAQRDHVPHDFDERCQPIAWRYSLRNRPNAPEMTRLPPSRFQPSRPNRKARRYSTTCTPGRNRPGTRASITRPSFTVHPFATRTVPPTAAMWRPSRNGRVRRNSASGSISVSASTAMTRGNRLALMAALRESALPPF